MTLRAALLRAREQLVGAGIPAEEGALDAELLGRQALDWDRATLFARLADEAPSTFEAAFRPLLARRLRREPMAYILGSQEFWGREFLVGPGVLIPRPETELLVEEAIAYGRERGQVGPVRVVDACTGSGCLAVTLALQWPSASVLGTDISIDALAAARQNAKRLGASVDFRLTSLLDGVAAPVDLIVANPPYVTAAEYDTLQPEVRAFEPRVALVGGVDGLNVVRTLVETAGRTLGPGGRLLMEFGVGQADAVGRIVTETGRLVLLRIRDDLQGTPRAVVATRRAD